MALCSIDKVITTITCDSVIRMHLNWTFRILRDSLFNTLECSTNLKWRQWRKNKQPNSQFYFIIKRFGINAKWCVQCVSWRKIATLQEKIIISMPKIAENKLSLLLKYTLMCQTLCIHKHQSNCVIKSTDPPPVWTNTALAANYIAKISEFGAVLRYIDNDKRINCWWYFKFT